jgi:hypothetical protein
MYKAFEGPNGWYVAFESADGSHRQPANGGNLTAAEADGIARGRNEPELVEEDDQ